MRASIRTDQPVRFTVIDSIEEFCNCLYVMNSAQVADLLIWIPGVVISVACMKQSCRSISMSSKPFRQDRCMHCKFSWSDLEYSRCDQLHHVYLRILNAIGRRTICQCLLSHSSAPLLHKSIFAEGELLMAMEKTSSLWEHYCSARTLLPRRVVCVVGVRHQ
jgi:hypothetical protein